MPAALISSTLESVLAYMEDRSLISVCESVIHSLMRRADCSVEPWRYLVFCSEMRSLFIVVNSANAAMTMASAIRITAMRPYLVLLSVPVIRCVPFGLQVSQLEASTVLVAREPSRVAPLIVGTGRQAPLR